MNNKSWWYYLKTIVLVLRVVVFEKYGTVAVFLWWIFIGIGAFVVWDVHYGAALAVAVLGLAAHGGVREFLLGKKYLLIRKGDSVEYALPDDTEAVQRFSSGRVLYRMRREDAAKTSLFDADHLDLYEHFYLVDIGKKNAIIPYEWIMGIETGELAL